jgi:hypothetical protein
VGIGILECEYGPGAGVSISGGRGITTPVEHFRSSKYVTESDIDCSICTLKVLSLRTYEGIKVRYVRGHITVIQNSEVWREIMKLYFNVPLKI